MTLSPLHYYLHSPTDVHEEVVVLTTAGQFFSSFRSSFTLFPVIRPITDVVNTLVNGVGVKVAT